MFDKEIEAIAKCTELIKDLDDAAKVRVLKYLIERFEIGTNPIHTTNFKNGMVTLGQANTSEILDENSSFEEHNYPSLKELLIKNYPKNEPEWILCYAFYASNFGKDTFTKDDVSEKYRENNRYSDNNRKNLVQNVNGCIKKDWIKPVNNDFILKADGLSYVKEIMAGNSAGKERKAVKRKNSNGVD